LGAIVTRLKAENLVLIKTPANKTLGQTFQQNLQKSNFILIGGKFNKTILKLNFHKNQNNLSQVHCQHVHFNTFGFRWNGSAAAPKNSVQI
jgi:hypothetical protein